MSLHTIPSNKDNQDIVSMGANAAWMAQQTIDNAFDIAAILAVALSQGVEAAGAGERLSTRSRILISAGARAHQCFGPTQCFPNASQP